MWRVPLAVGAAAAAVVLCAPAVGGSTYSGLDGRIVFVRDDGLSTNIWSVEPDGTAAVALTSGSFLDEEPAWSPDGTRIVFSSNRPGGGLDVDIFAMNGDGTGLQQLTFDGGDTCPTWSPDGTRIAFSNGDGNIVVMNADGSDPIVLAPVDTCELNWSPLGDAIAFVPNTETGIQVVNVADPSQITTLTTDQDEHPHWSPDGTTIAFTRTAPDGSASIWSIPAGGGSATQLTGGPADTEPAYAPAGDAIVFSRCELGLIECALYLMAPDGSSPRLLLEMGESVSLEEPDWQPLQAPPPPPPPTPVRVTPAFTG